MSYLIGEHKDGGYAYSVTVNGLTMTGWRRGTRDQVEDYVKQSERMCTARASGMGFTRVNKQSKLDTSHLRGARKSAEVRRK